MHTHSGHSTALFFCRVYYYLSSLPKRKLPENRSKCCTHSSVWKHQICEKKKALKYLAQQLSEKEQSIEWNTISVQYAVNVYVEIDIFDMVYCVYLIPMVSRKDPNTCVCTTCGSSPSQQKQTIVLPSFHIYILERS